MLDLDERGAAVETAVHAIDIGRTRAVGGAEGGRPIRGRDLDNSIVHYMQQGSRDLDTV